MREWLIGDFFWYDKLRVCDDFPPTLSRHSSKTTFITMCVSYYEYVCSSFE